MKSPAMNAEVLLLYIYILGQSSLLRKTFFVVFLSSLSVKAPNGSLENANDCVKDDELG